MHLEGEIVNPIALRRGGGYPLYVEEEVADPLYLEEEMTIYQY